MKDKKGRGADKDELTLGQGELTEGVSGKKSFNSFSGTHVRGVEKGGENEG